MQQALLSPLYTSHTKAQSLLIKFIVMGRGGLAVHCECVHGTVGKTKAQRAAERIWRQLSLSDRAHWGSSDTLRGKRGDRLPSCTITGHKKKRCKLILASITVAAAGSGDGGLHYVHLCVLFQRKQQFEHQLLIYTEVNKDEGQRCESKEQKKRENGDGKMTKIKELSVGAKCHGANTSPVIFSDSLPAVSLCVIIVYMSVCGQSLSQL